MKKVLNRIVIGLLVLLLILAVVLGLFLDKITRREIETIGQQITQVQVKLDAVHISLLTGSASLKGLTVANPEGCQTPEAISVGTISIGVNSLSILSDKIVIRSVHVEAPEVTFEGSVAGNNLSKILDNVNSAGKNGPPASPNQTAQATSKPGKKFEVDDLLIVGAKVHVQVTGLGKPETLVLPDIHLTDLGRGPEGITGTEVTQRVLDVLISSTIKAIANDPHLRQSLENLGKQGLEKATSRLDHWFK